jgi:hypothetical protein
MLLVGACIGKGALVNAYSTLSSLAVCLFALGGVACSSDSKGGTAQTDADGFQELYTYDWTIDPGAETYFCGYRTLKEDLYVSDFRPIMPTGTHHVVIGYQNPVGDDRLDRNGEGTCTGTTFGDIFAYVGTVGAQDFSMPKGVAVKIPAGQQLVFGLHVLNSGSSPLSGHSGVSIIKPVKEDVDEVAEVVAMGPFNLSIPPEVETTQSGTCTMTDDVNVFAVMPHMHLTGKHISTTVFTGGTEKSLLDAPYVFTEQVFTKIDPPQALEKGDVATVTCTYQNPGPQTLGFGESTTGGEMCFTFAYRYPALTPNLPPNVGFARGICSDPTVPTP